MKLCALANDIHNSDLSLENLRKNNPQIYEMLLSELKKENISFDSLKYEHLKIYIFEFERYLFYLNLIDLSLHNLKNNNYRDYLINFMLFDEMNIQQKFLIHQYTFLDVNMICYLIKIYYKIFSKNEQILLNDILNIYIYLKIYEKFVNNKSKNFAVFLKIAKEIANNLYDNGLKKLYKLLKYFMNSHEQRNYGRVRYEETKIYHGQIKNIEDFCKLRKKDVKKTLENIKREEHIHNYLLISGNQNTKIDRYIYFVYFQIIS